MQCGPSFTTNKRASPRTALQEKRRHHARAEAAGLGPLRFFDAVEAINDLHRNELRLWLNLYQPSVKLVKKMRVGSKLQRVYDAPQTPLERVASPQGDSARVAEWKNLTTGFPLRLGIPHSPRDSRFPTATAAARLPLWLHFKWRDNPGYGYILEWLYSGNVYRCGFSSSQLGSVAASLPAM